MSNNLRINNKKENRIRDLRKEAGMTQQEVADKIGVCLKTYQNWERCNTDDNFGVDHVSDLINLANVYGVSVDYLINNDDFISPENSFIGKKTGLSDKSIFMLKEWNNKKNGLFIQKDLDTLNFVLGECYERNKKNTSEEQLLPERSILHLIGNYITKQAFKIAHLNRVTVKTNTNNYITFEEGESPLLLNEPSNQKIDNCIITEIHDDRSEEYGLCDSDYTPESHIPVIYNDNEEMGVIQLDESLIEASIMNKIKNELDYLKQLKEPTK